ncbi:MAG: cobalt transporter CbiM [Desulfuromonadales bacterium]|nr:cobalt transporter CbiM [Desulfuromonadales bacterium]
MHIPDGILPLPVTLGGYTVAIGIAWYCIRKINQRADPREDVPKAALLTAVFFAASLIHIPLPPASVHFVLAGLLGALLGIFAFPAILVGLFFQAVLFGHGGLTILGINSLIVGLPALMAAGIFQQHKRTACPSGRRTAVFGFVAGAGATAISVVLFALILVFFMPAHLDAAVKRSALMLLLLSHIPLVLVEGAATAFIVVYLRRVKPRLLGYK